MTDPEAFKVAIDIGLAEAVERYAAQLGPQVMTRHQWLALDEAIAITATVLTLVAEERESRSG